MTGTRTLRVFPLSGTLACDATGAPAEGDRSMIRPLTNVLFCNLAIVLAVLLW